MDKKQLAMEKHREWQGKIEVVPRASITNMEELAVAYTPGVAEPCLAIQREPELSFDLTRRGNLVAVITDGTAVLGLGDIGPTAGMPVMEGKCALFKTFAGVDAFPLCIDSKDPQVIVDTIARIAGSFGGINLEDIAAPRCFEIEAALKKRLDIPVFHDDQHGTAIVVAAALLNAAKVTDRQLGKLRIVINGAGAAGLSIAGLLLEMGFGDVVLCDIQGALYRGAAWMNPAQAKMAEIFNRENRRGSLAEVLLGADVFIGVSRPGLVTAEMVATMAKEPIVFAMANPTPEILPEEAKKGGAAVVGTGRSDYPTRLTTSWFSPASMRFSAFRFSPTSIRSSASRRSPASVHSSASRLSPASVSFSASRAESAMNSCPFSLRRTFDMISSVSDSVSIRAPFASFSS